MMELVSKLEEARAEASYTLRSLDEDWILKHATMERSVDT